MRTLKTRLGTTYFDLLTVRDCDFEQETKQDAKRVKRLDKIRESLKPSPRHRTESLKMILAGDVLTATTPNHDSNTNYSMVLNGSQTNIFIP